MDGSISEDGIVTSIHGLYNSFKFEVHSRFDTVFALLLEILVLQIREMSEVTEIFAKL